jgi:hypothetical protein
MSLGTPSIFSLFGFCSLQVDGDLEATDLMIRFFHVFLNRKRFDIDLSIKVN